MTPSSSDLSDRNRLLLILRAFLICEEIPTGKALSKQFKVETGRFPKVGDLRWVLRREGW